jgi:hypothetical protein
VLTKISKDEQSKRDMRNKCTNYYRINQRELKKIDQFQRMYTPAKAIEWCTDDCFIHKLFNRPVRKEYIDLIYVFRIFIIDLSQQIEREKMKVTLIDFNRTRRSISKSNYTADRLAFYHEKY